MTKGAVVRLRVRVPGPMMISTSRISQRSRARIAVVAAGLLVAGMVNGSGVPGRPHQAAAETPVAPVTGCSAADDQTRDPATAATVDGKPVPRISGGAFQA